MTYMKKKNIEIEKLIREIKFHDQKSSHNKNSRNQWLQ